MVGAVLLGQVAPAAAETTGPQTFTIVGVDGSDRVIASGVVSGFGTLISVDNESDQFVFEGGTFTATHPETGGTFEFNELTCIGQAPSNARTR